MIKLNQSTIRLISSSYVISSIELLVKELVENSLDAGSSRIWINLKRFGLDKIDVIDDGCGFNDVSLICQRYCTSKISDYHDIENVNTFGFRGEVLASICSVSNLTITSNNDENSSPLGNTWAFDKMGNVIAQSIISCKQGSTISVSNIFHNLPVRCQMYNSLFELQKSMKFIKRYLEQLYLSRSNIQINLVNDNATILKLPICSSRKESIACVIGSIKFKCFSEITKLKEITNENHMKLDIFVPNCFDDNLGLTNQDYRENCNLFINGRPSEVPHIFKAVRNAYNAYNKNANIKRNVARYPSFILYLDLPPAWIDVNTDPDKRKLRLSNIHDITQFIETTLMNFYDDLTSSNVPTNDEINELVEIPNQLTPLPVNYVRPIRSSTFNEDRNVNIRSDDIFSDFEASLSSEVIDENIHEDAGIHNSEISGSDKTNNIELDQNFALGRVPKLPCVPIRNISLKRMIQTDANTEALPNKIPNKEDMVKSLKINLISKNLAENIATEPFIQNQRSSSLSVIPLKVETCSQNRFISQDIRVISHWDSFIIYVETQKSRDTSDLLIFCKDHLVFASTYLENMENIQMPSEILSQPISINEINDDLLKALQKLPTQLIHNNKVGKEFYVVSCPHLLKNGYRIHCMKTDDISRFKVVNKPVCVDDEMVLDEIAFIVEHSVDSNSMIRTNANRQWIFSTSKNISETKLNSEIKNLTGKRLREYFNCCMNKIIKYQSVETLDNFLPEIFRFNLNKC